MQVKLREKVLRCAISMARHGLSRNTSGNVSARDVESGLLAITPTNVPYEELQAMDIALLDQNGNMIDGRREPSSEMPMHVAVYRARPDVDAIVHTHSVHATTFAVLGKSLPPVTVPLALIGGVEVVPFELPGSTELALACVETLGEDGQAVLLRNHGLLCVAKTIEEALSRAIYIEEGAQVALLAHLAGGMNPIPEHAVAQIRERYLKK